MKYIFCIDLDGTLKTDPDFDCTGFPSAIRVTTSKTYDMVPRNNIQEFLAAAKNKGTVYMTTAAGTAYGEKVSKALDVYQYFDDIVGADRMIRQQWPNMGRDKKIIWIDNDREGLEGKIRHLPYNVRHLEMETWIIDTFMGNPDNVAQELIEEINKLE